MSKSSTRTPEGRGRVVVLRRAGPRGAARERLRLEADGQTHRRDCECARCEAGFTPSERERAQASRRVAEKQGRLMAVRAAERRKEKARLAQAELFDYFRKGHAATDAEVQRLRAARAKAVADLRLDELLRLRKLGWDLGAALAEVDHRWPLEGGDGAGNDNGRGAGGSGAGGAAGAGDGDEAVVRRARVSGDLFS